MSQTLYILYSGYGRDGGFGDYAGVDWSDHPVQINGKTVWFDDAETANKTVDELNKRASEKFYSTGFHQQYDGDFPMEYKVQEILIPNNAAFDYSVVEELTKTESSFWMSDEYDYEDDYDYMEEYKNWLTENNLPMSDENYDAWVNAMNEVNYD